MPRMRCLNVLLPTCLIATCLIAEATWATVRIDHAVRSGTVYDPEFDVHLVEFGRAFEVDVTVGWDGQGALSGVFTSTSFDASVLELVSARFGSNAFNAFRGSLFPFVDEDGNVTVLSRFGQNQLQQPGDPAGVIRTVQYGSLHPIHPGGARTQLVTTLTFRLIGPGQSDIGTFLAPGDAGALGDALSVGSALRVVAWDGPVIPEPATALLLGLGLATLATTSRSRSR